ncbi:MAG TPA: hypothetical protein VG708_11615 [Mycobacteriales bacterium]|nr:hypothetical protein [Mycobacteriales bacterium]
MRRALGVATSAAIVLVGSGATAAISAPNAPAAHASTPHLAVTASKGSFKVTGPTSFAAGRVAFSLHAVGKERETAFMSFKKGYGLKDLRADLETLGESDHVSKSGLRHLNRAINHTHLWGGLDAIAGQTLRGTVVLPKAGTYYIVDDSNAVPSHAQKLKVTGPAVHRAKPHSDATVTALTAVRFGGAKVLPAHGTITFRNKSTESPHFLDLIQVQPGTTKKDVLNAFTSNAGPAPFLGAQAGTDVLGKGLSQTLSYKLPKGTYAEVCFFPDPKTGMPHAFMGMIRIVTLK